MTDEITGSAIGVDIDAAVRTALADAKHGKAYEIANIRFEPWGFTGIGHETIVLLSEVETPNKAILEENRNLAFSKEDIRDVYAWWNAMPGDTPSLHVTGRVEINGEKYVVRATIDGYEKNYPPTLLLKLNAVKVRCSGTGAFHFHQAQSAPGSLGMIKLIVPDGDPYIIENIETAH